MWFNWKLFCRNSTRREYVTAEYASCTCMPWRHMSLGSRSTRQALRLYHLPGLILKKAASPDVTKLRRLTALVTYVLHIGPLSSPGKPATNFYTLEGRRMLRSWSQLNCCYCHRSTDTDAACCWALLSCWNFTCTLTIFTRWHVFYCFNLSLHKFAINSLLLFSLYALFLSPYYEMLRTVNVLLFNNVFRPTSHCVGKPLF